MSLSPDDLRKIADEYAEVENEMHPRAVGHRIPQLLAEIEFQRKRVDRMEPVLRQSLHARQCNAPFGQTEKYPSVEEFKAALDENAPTRCDHGVWLADHCFDCDMLTKKEDPRSWLTHIRAAALALIAATPIKNGAIFTPGSEAAKLLAGVDEAHRHLEAALKEFG